MTRLFSWLDRLFIALTMRLNGFTKESILVHSNLSKQITSMDYVARFSLGAGLGASQTRVIITEYGFFTVITGLVVSYRSLGGLNIPPLIQVTNKRTGKVIFGNSFASINSAAGPGNNSILTEPKEIFLPLMQSEPVEIQVIKGPGDPASMTVTVILTGWKWEGK